MASIFVHFLENLFTLFHLLIVLTFAWVIFLAIWVLLLELCTPLMKIFEVYEKIIVIFNELSVFIIILEALLFIMRFLLLHLQVALYRFNTRLGGLTSMHQVRDGLKRRCLILSWSLVASSRLLWELSPIDIQIGWQDFGLRLAYCTRSAFIGCERPALNWFFHELRWNRYLFVPSSINGWLWEIVSLHWRTRREELSKNSNSNIILK